MTGDKRNASVVIALIASMTVGAVVLLCLESWLFPEKPRWTGDISLTAERGLRVQEVEVAYARSLAEVDPDAFALDDSICLIDADGLAQWEARGPRVRLVVIGSDADTLADVQKRTLLGALGSMSQASGLDLVPVRFAAESDAQHNSDLSPQAEDLWEFLVRKGFIE